MAKNWIDKHYPVGCEVKVIDTRTGQLKEAKVTAHTVASGTIGVTGIIVLFDGGTEEGTYQEISAAFLDEGGGDRTPF